MQPQSITSHAPQDSESPGIHLDRDVEQDVLRLVSAPARKPVTLIFLGPRGSGKTSLVARTAQAAVRAARIVCTIDFADDFDPSQRGERNAFLTRFSQLLAHRLTGATDGAPPDVMVTLETLVFPRLPEQASLTVILENIDAIVLAGHALEVYRMLRNLHEQGRTSSGPYSDIDWIFTSTLELDVLNTLFDINVESPFNIAMPYQLSDLSRYEVLELGHRFPSWSDEQLEQLHELLAGHPELTQDALARGPDVLRKPKASFRVHLDEVRKALASDRPARKALDRLKKGENVQLHAFAKVKQDYQRVAYLLSSVGVLRPKGVGFVIRNELYRDVL